MRPVTRCVKLHTRRCCRAADDRKACRPPKQRGGAGERRGVVLGGTDVQRGLGRAVGVRVAGRVVADAPHLRQARVQARSAVRRARVHRYRTARSEARPDARGPRRAVAANAHPAGVTVHAVRALDVMLAIVAPRSSRRASTSSFATSSGPTALVRNTLQRAAAKWQAQPGRGLSSLAPGCISTWVHVRMTMRAGSAAWGALTPRAAQSLMVCWHGL